MTRYNDTHNDVIGDLSDEMEYGVGIGYREGVDAVMSYLDTESSFQIRCLIEEGQI